MKTHAKVWLWIVFIASILSVLSYVRIITLSAYYGLYIVLCLALVVATSLMLFKSLKLGFYLYCVLAVIAFILNLSIMHINFIFALIGLIAGPLITYLFIKSSWDSFS